LRLVSPRGIIAGFSNPQLEDIGQRALSLAERLQDDLLTYRALFVLLNYHIETGAYQAATAESERMLALAQSLDDEDFAVWVRGMCGQIHMTTGQFAAVVSDVEPILARWKAGGLESLRARLNQRQLSVCTSLVRIIMALTPMGQSGRARGYLNEALEMGRAAGPGYDQCYLTGVVAFFHCDTRDHEKALKWSIKYRAQAEKAGIATHMQISRAFECWARGQMGEAQVVLDTVRDLLAHAEATNYRSVLPQFVFGLADCYLAAGRAQEALATASRGVNLCVQEGSQWFLVNLQLIRGKALLLLDPPDSAGAEAAFLEAIAVARRQEARLYELHAAVELGRLWLSQGRGAEARALVQPVYDWFTEGFELRDLVEARELLESV
jgi:tetratricopeptide (TPR) repeat protein